VKSSNLVKIAAAFLIGVVVTLGSALLYMRTAEVSEKAPNIASAVPERNQTPESEVLPSPETDIPASTQIKTPPKSKENQAKPLSKTKTEAKPKPLRPVPIKKSEKEPITVIAQSYPQTGTPPSTPAEAPSPAVNEPAPLPPMPSTTMPESSAPTPPATRELQPHVVTLQAGTNLSIRLGETLSSDHNYTGDTFRGTLEAPVIVDGFIIADRGSKVLGKVINVQEAGRVQGLSTLSLTLTEINTTDGQRVRVQTDSYEKRGLTSTGSDAAKIAGSAALGAIIGAIAGGGKGAAIGAGAGGAAGTGIVLATRGKPTALPVETHLTFRLASPVTITEQINN
jgi:hypothetical protein